MTLETSSVLETLGLDAETVEWQDFALCSEMDTNLFYDKYESSLAIARTIDEMCLSCPVMKQCLQTGTEDGEWGVWGSLYLVSGKPDKNRNSHKTPEVWNEIRSIIYGE